MSSGSIRRSGLAAMLGGVLGTVRSPILAHLWDTYTTFGRLYFLSLPPELLGLYALRKLRGGESVALDRWGFRS